MARYSKELSSEAFGTDLAPRTASPPNSARLRTSNCGGLTGTASHLGHTAPVRPDWKEQPERSRTPGSPHSWLTSQEAQIELATRREDRVTRTMEGSTRSRAHRGREPWTDPRIHDDAERFLWGAAIILLLYIPCFSSTGSGGSREHALA